MRTPRPHFLFSLIAVGLAACTAPAGPVPVDPAGNAASSTGILTAPAALKAQSCPAGTQFIPPSEFAIAAEPVALSDRAAWADLPPGVQFAGGWALTSDHAGFGGLSGIERLPNGDFLTVSDTGAFVWIGREAGKLNGRGRIAYMRGQDGNPLKGKAEGDSEGLAMRDGLAYVSFERRHRIEAFDLESCGAAARAALAASLPVEIEGRNIRENAGPEALSAGKTLRAGIEQLMDGTSPLIDLTMNDVGITLLEPLGPDYDSPLVGMSNPVALGEQSIAGSVVYSLRRNYKPLFGNWLSVEAEYVDAGGSSRRGLFTLARPMNVDNFEGITVETLPDGIHRLWIISDDNFSDRQRTLLFAFDLVGEAH